MAEIPQNGTPAVVPPDVRQNNQLLYPLTDPIITPLTKYFCSHG